MQETVWLLEPIGIWFSGGTWEQIKASKGFMHLVLLAAVLIPSSLIAMGAGLADARETPLARWFGVNPRSRDADWAERARDLDKDGRPDF